MKTEGRVFSVKRLFILALMAAFLMPQSAQAQSNENQLHEKLRQSTVQLDDIAARQKQLDRSIADIHAELERSQDIATQEADQLYKKHEQLVSNRGILENDSRQQSAQLENRQNGDQAKSTLLGYYRTRLAAVRDDYETYQVLANEPLIWPYLIERNHISRPYGAPREFVIKRTVRRYFSELKNSGGKIDLDELTKRLKIEQTIADALRERIRNDLLPKTKTQLESWHKKIDALESPAVTTVVTAVAQNNTPADDLYYASKCPEKNPGDAKNPNRLKYTFDTNNTPADGEHVVCRYWKDGDLNHEKPYKNYKEHGISYFYFWNTPHHLKWVRRHTNGLKDGPQTDFNQTKEGKHYKFAESERILGEVQQYTRYREDGSVHYVDTFSNGKKTSACVYPVDGGAARCSEF